jgi:penicillin amidase
MYGDKSGNIAWWAAAKLVKRPPQVNSKIILDGSSGNDDYLGFYDFSQNPKCINPECGFVFSANNQPDTMAGILYPGYYAPEFRAKRIVNLLGQDKLWTIDEMKKMITDNVSEIHPEMARLILSAVDKQELEPKGNNCEKAFQLLNDWKGAHNTEDIEPTLYYKLLYNVLNKTFADEIGENAFDAISSGHMMGNTYPFLFKDENSLWWDDKKTLEKETRQDIFKSGFYKTVDNLEKQLGMNMDSWKWEKVHLLKHGHPIGTVKPFDKIFNVGPIAAPGGNQTLNNIDFDFNKNGIYESTYGPAVRILLDFSDPENSVSILPTGESGNFMSPHYADQAEMYAKGEFRKQMMNKDEIVKTSKGKLVLVPEK